MGENLRDLHAAITQIINEKIAFASDQIQKAQERIATLKKYPEMNIKEIRLMQKTELLYKGEVNALTDIQSKFDKLF